MTLLQMKIKLHLSVWASLSIMMIFLFDAEYTEFEVEDSILAKQSQYYASVGYRMDSVIVHFTYEDNDDEHDSSRFDIPLNPFHLV